MAPPKVGFNKYRIDGDTTYFEITNRKGLTKEVEIDTEDLQQLIDLDYSWHFMFDPRNGLWYVKSSPRFKDENGKMKGSSLQLQRVIMKAEKDTKVDHIDHNPLNNKKENLRVTRHDKNTKHRKSKNINNTSGYRNVSEIDGKWVVQLQINGKNTVLGRFDDIDKSGKFAEEMREKYYGVFKGEN